MFDVKKDALEYARENKELLKEAARRHKPTLSELANRNSPYAKPALLQRFEGLTWNDILDEDEKKEFLAQEEPEISLQNVEKQEKFNTKDSFIPTTFPRVRDDKRNLFNSTVESFLNFTKAPQNNDSFLNQTTGALQDLGKSYIDMVNANLKSSDSMKEKGTTIDNYYHCIGNYDAAKRGKWGRATAETVGFGREFGELLSSLIKSRKIYESYKDFFNDMKVNSEGRRMADSNLYKSALEACEKYRPEGYSDFEKLKYYIK
ncbi:MAG: hypothetical protein IJ689_05905 [Alphaproteobacteria bacterium]|nr:hypothetical protein [Alphaproteobacteria bacterium]